ncbi:helix-turn-helix domain-containing protein [Paenibacillus antri]|uniref:Helix-turn-helix domain-containing protein n=1 Tax=Paenibacillus antri TaxID=2582848 RepID=A0A5R9G2N5_9BACL|nr:helix-turn-helix domain-containing protein [Paenibacillus antri]TLS50612.1 helix-turn-helix domain-containing protein [Paenibacillus antri]
MKLRADKVRVMLRKLRQRLETRISRRYFYKLIGLGLVSVVVPIMLISFFSYRITVSNMEGQNDQARFDMLGQLQSRVDERLETARNALYALVFDSDITQAANMNGAAIGPQLLIDVQGKLSTLTQSIQDSYGVSLYFVDSETTLFNDRYIKKSDASWVSDFPKHGPVGEWMYQTGSGFQVVTHTVALPAMSESPKAYLSIHLHQRAFAGILRDIDFIESADVYFLDVTFKPILARTQGEVEGAQTEAGLDWIRGNPRVYDIRNDAKADLSTQYVQSERTGWYTALMVPLSSQSAFTADIVGITVLVSLLAIGAGAVLIYFNSKRLYAPIRQWLQDENYTPEDQKKDEWAWLRSRWNNLKEDLQRSAPELREAFLISLLGGYYAHAKEEAEALMKRHHLPHDHKCVALVVDPGDFSKYRSFEAKDEALVHMAIANIFEELISHSYLEGDSFHRPEAYQSVLLVYFPRDMKDEQARQMAKQLAQSLIQSIETYLKFPITLGLGGIRPVMHELRESYLEAKEALQYRIIREDEPILDFHEVKQDSGRFDYPFDISEQIVKDLRSGNREEVERGFNVFVDLIRACNYSDAVYRKILLMLYSATIQGFYQYSKEAMSDLINQNGHEIILSAQFLTEIEQWFRDTWFAYCFAIIDHENESKGKQVIDAVKSYISRTLNQDHSLQLVAEQVNLNPSYLSRLFRKETGQNFVQYVAQIKVEEAKKQLEQTDEPIYRIAEHVGYTEQTFRRVFKNLTKMSPNEYRTSIRK